MAALAPAAGRGPGRARRVRPRPPALDRAGVRRRAGPLADPPPSCDAALAADDARPTVHLLARPGEITAAELAAVTGGEPAPYSPYGVHLAPGAGDLGELDAVAGAARASCRTRAASWSRSPSTRAPLDRAGRRPLARPVRRPRRQVRAARRRWPPSTAARWTPWRSSRAPRRAGAPGHRRACRSPCTPADGRDRAAARRRRSTGCSSTRPAPASARCAAARRRAGGASRRTSAGSTALQRELLPAALRHVRPGGVVAYVTCSPHLAETVGVVADVRRAAPSVEQLDARELPARRARPRRRARPCSSGRTGTAPTRCSSRCCAARSDGAVAAPNFRWSSRAGAPVPARIETTPTFPGCPSGAISPLPSDALLGQRVRPGPTCRARSGSGRRCARGGRGPRSPAPRGGVRRRR